MVSRITVEDIIDQLWDEDSDSGEFEVSTDESEVDSELVNEGSDESGTGER